jgi:hypothetical protein
MIRLAGAWLTPALLLALTARLVSGGREGLWLGLLVVVAPLFAGLRPVRRSPEAAGVPGGTLAVLVGGLLLWANLSLAGDLAAWAGGSRWHGILPLAGAVALLSWRGGARAGRALALAAFVGLALPLAWLAHAAGTGPAGAWSEVASATGFRFGPGSPWVREGRPVGSRPGDLVLLFEEDHRVTPLDPGPLGVEVADRARRQLQEWTLPPGEGVTLRPGDRLHVDGSRRLRFQEERRVPGAPPSGVEWADGSFPTGAAGALAHAGLAVTLLGGALALAFGGALEASRARAALAGLGLVAALGWALCWAVYTMRAVPEVFLGGVSASRLVEASALALAGSLGGRGLAWLLLAGLLALGLASALALRDLLRPAADATVWGGVLLAAAVAALGPAEPGALLLAALGLGASTLGPLALVGHGAPARAVTWALALGAALFVALAGAARLDLATDPPARALLDYPALLAGPAAAAALRVAGRRAAP